LHKPGSVGRPFPNVEVHVLDDDGARCAPGISGTVWFRQPDAFVYKDDPEQTAGAQRDGLITLGDIGHVDEDGYLFLDDRRADVIVSGGVNIYPAQIEAVLLAHPTVTDCCVVGVPDPEWGEAVHAVVQVVPGETGGEDRAALAAELLAWCRARLGTYQVPRSIEWTGRLPRTETGKLARRAIRDPYWAGRKRRI
jgi:long-chain acyl-CoA synthetase